MKKKIALTILNERIQSFTYGFADSNKIPTIKREHIIIKRKLKMSAAEMILFCRYFGLLIGDFVEEDNKIWSLYILLSK